MALALLAKEKTWPGHVTTKKLAQRIDLNYFKRPTPLKRAKILAKPPAACAALVWIAWRGLSGDHRVYSSGRMSEPHAVLEKECVACHAQKSRRIFRQGRRQRLSRLPRRPHPSRHANVNLLATCIPSIVGASTSRCAQSGLRRCHEDLKASGNSARFASHIRSFEDAIPNSRPLQKVHAIPARSN